MAAFEDIREALETYFDANFTESGVGKYFMNTKGEPDADDEWVRFNVLMNDAYRLIINGGTTQGIKHVGIIMVQIFVPVGTGTGRGAAIADVIYDLFLEKKLATDAGKEVVTFVPKYQYISSDQTWSHFNCVVPFEYLT